VAGCLKNIVRASRYHEQGIFRLQPQSNHTCRPSKEALLYRPGGPWRGVSGCHRGLREVQEHPRGCAHDGDVNYSTSLSHLRSRIIKSIRLFVYGLHVEYLRCLQKKTRYEGQMTFIPPVDHIWFPQRRLARLMRLPIMAAFRRICMITRRCSLIAGCFQLDS
jgi:hypothetical protein